MNLSKTNKLKDMVDEIKKTDTTTYLSIISEINNYEVYSVRDYLEKLTEHQVAKLSDAQIYTLYAMQYKGGHQFNFYRRTGKAGSPFMNKLEAGYTSTKSSWRLSISGISIDDLQYISQYHINQWKKNNGTGRGITKGLNAKIAMDEFSLIIFKESITKTLNQTEAKNYILSINKAFNEVPENLASIKLRNKFYKVVIDNTKTHSKAMINLIHTTKLIQDEYEVIDSKNTLKVTVYPIEADETVALYMYWDKHALKAYAPDDAHNTYASDLTVVPGNTNVASLRDQMRYASGASMFLTMHARTGNHVYLNNALALLEAIPEDAKTKIKSQTQAVATLNDILKQGITNE